MPTFTPVEHGGVGHNPASCRICREFEYIRIREREMVSPECPYIREETPEELKKFYICGIYNRTRYRVRGVDLIRVIPRLIKMGKFKAIYGSWNWNDRLTGRYINCEVYFYKRELDRFIANYNITVLPPDALDDFNPEQVTEEQEQEQRPIYI